MQNGRRFLNTFELSIINRKVLFIIIIFLITEKREIPPSAPWQAAVHPETRRGGSASHQSPSTPPSRPCPSSPCDTTSGATPGRWQCLPLHQWWCLQGVLSCKRPPLHLQSSSRYHLHLSLQCITRRSQLRSISNLRSTVHFCLRLLTCRSRQRPLLQGVSHPGR